MSLGCFYDVGGWTRISAAATFGQQASRQYTPEVQKHIYVHVPPPDHEVLPAPRVVTYDRPVKHYKIIFIKAPSPTPQQQPVLPAPPMNYRGTPYCVCGRETRDAVDASPVATFP
uniref:DUF243 domain-containing protein n=1 Tax=Phlebotomus papatasi TaxID=29031 RepID=A0A1B0EVL2_PHLPP